MFNGQTSFDSQQHIPYNKALKHKAPVHSSNKHNSFVQYNGYLAGDHTADYYNDDDDDEDDDEDAYLYEFEQDTDAENSADNYRSYEDAPMGIDIFNKLKRLLHFSSSSDQNENKRKRRYVNI